MDQILENSFPPEDPDLPQDLNHWSVESHLEGKVPSYQFTFFEIAG